MSKKNNDANRGFDVLTPSRYVGAAEIDDDGIPFDEKMAELTVELRQQFAKSDELEKKNKEEPVGVRV